MSVPHKSAAVDIASARPFARAALEYLEKGWYPMPLPPRQKEEPPRDFTGWHNPSNKINHGRVQSWIDNKVKGAKANIALRPHETMYALDVDAYKGKSTLDSITDEIGTPLPATWVNSARDDGVSGHYVFKVPAGLRWPSKPAPGIESLHFGHRYLVAAPSVHPDFDRHYRWYTPGTAIDGTGTFDIPDWEDIPELPQEWIDYLTSGQAAKHYTEKELPGEFTDKLAAASAWLNARTGTMCAIMLRSVDKAIDLMSAPDPHETALAALFSVLQLSGEGHGGVGDAVIAIRDAYITERTEHADRHTSQDNPYDSWNRMFLGGIAKTMHREDDGAFDNMSCACAALKADGTPTFELNVGSFKLSDAVSACYPELAPDAAGHGAYLTGGRLSLYRSGRLSELSVDGLRVFLDERIHCYKVSDGEHLPATPPDSLVRGLLEHDGRSVLPELAGIVHTPFWLPNAGSTGTAGTGSTPELVKTNGYHPGAKVYMDMTPDMAELVGKIECAPLPSWIAKAQWWVGELFAGFPFEGKADRAAAYAALIQPFVRDLIAGPTPVYLFGSPVAGTGKGLLTDSIAGVAIGALRGDNGYHLIGVRKSAGRDEELSKALVSAMRKLPSFLIMDNIGHMLGGTDLASAITNYPNFQGRMLGTSNEFEVPNRTLWAITANNLQATDEILRRIVPCRLDAGMSRPDTREFAVDLRTWVPENRPALVWAVNTLIANWVQQGCPESDLNMGSFERWAAVIGGILECNGIDGLLSNRNKFRASSADQEVRLDALIYHWRDSIGIGFDNYQTSSQLVTLAHGIDFPIPSTKGEHGAATSLGRMLHAMRGVPIDGLTVELSSKDGRAIYFLQDARNPVESKRRRRRRSKPAGPK